MKTFNKILLSMAAVTTVLAPLAPKSFSVNINLGSKSTLSDSKERAVNINLESKSPVEPKERKFTSTDTQCDLTFKTITDTGLQICEYHCRSADNTTVFKTFRSNAAICPATTTEKLKDYQ